SHSARSASISSTAWTYRSWRCRLSSSSSRHSSGGMRRTPKKIASPIGGLPIGEGGALQRPDVLRHQPIARLRLTGLSPAFTRVTDQRRLFERVIANRQKRVTANRQQRIPLF